MDRSFALERRHRDGQRWLRVMCFATRADAQAALASLADDRHPEADELRVHEVTVKR